MIERFCFIGVNTESAVIKTNKCVKLCDHYDKNYKRSTAVKPNKHCSQANDSRMCACVIDLCLSSMQLQQQQQQQTRPNCGRHFLGGEWNWKIRKNWRLLVDTNTNNAIVAVAHWHCIAEYNFWMGLNCGAVPNWHNARSIRCYLFYVVSVIRFWEGAVNSIFPNCLFPLYCWLMVFFSVGWFLQPYNTFTFNLVITEKKNFYIFFFGVLLCVCSVWEAKRTRVAMNVFWICQVTTVQQYDHSQFHTCTHQRPRPSVCVYVCVCASAFCISSATLWLAASYIWRTYECMGIGTHMLFAHCRIPVDINIFTFDSLWCLCLCVCAATAAYFMRLNFVFVLIFFF